MPTVFIPSPLRRWTNGAATVEASGETVRALIDDLESRFPGLRERLCEGDRLKPGLAVVVGTSVSSSGLMTKVPQDAEIHFVQAVGGG